MPKIPLYSGQFAPLFIFYFTIDDFVVMASKFAAISGPFNDDWQWI
jgi:hypothetical protein